MSNKKARKEKLSIYLARDSSKPDSALINAENAKDGIKLSLDEIDNAILYIKKDSNKSLPTWTQLFTDSGQVPENQFGVSSNVGAALIVRAHKKTFIISFGAGFHLVKHDEIERDFGLKVTLNSVEPDKLKSLDKASYDHNPLNSRTQSTRNVDIFNLHLDSEMEMLYAITGQSKVNVFGNQLTGRDALTIDVETEINGLSCISCILKECKQRYTSKLPWQFSWIENINRVRDTDDIEILDLELDNLLSTGNTSNLWLGEPEIVD